MGITWLDQSAPGDTNTPVRQFNSKSSTIGTTSL